MTEQTLDPEEKQWAQLRQEVDDSDTGVSETVLDEPSTSDQAPEPSQPEAPEPTQAENKITFEELERRHDQIKAALGESRSERRQLKARLDELTQLVQARDKAQEQQAPPPPSVEDDPVQHFDHRLQTQAQQIEAAQKAAQSAQEALQAQQQEKVFWDEVGRSMDAYKAQQPDFDAAMNHLVSTRQKEMETFYPDGPQIDAYAQQFGYPSAAHLRHALMQQEGQQIAMTAFQTGRSPAELYYMMAQQKGYAAQPVAPPAPVTPHMPPVPPMAQAAPAVQTNAVIPPGVQSARNGQAAATSLSGSGAAGEVDSVSISELTELYASDPERAEVLFQKMQRAGMLG